MKLFMFDIDGTLTPSSESMDPQFKRWFLNWKRDNSEDQHVFLCTGSDYRKITTQLGNDFLYKMDMVFCCGGNSVWNKGTEVHQEKWHPSGELLEFLNNALQTSTFPMKVGRHVEMRPGMINFSIVGRAANNNERVRYIDWDNRTKERDKIVEKFNQLFYNGNIVAQKAGETGIDIFPIGKDKGQIVKYFKYDYPFYFFGDSFDERTQLGNDYPLVKALKEQYEGPKHIHKVKNWQHTWQILKAIEGIKE